ncbi:unnamed protein product, partial [marine sediment metagenome]
KTKVEERIFQDAEVKGVAASDGEYSDKIEIIWEKFSAKKLVAYPIGLL